MRQLLTPRIAIRRLNMGGNTRGVECWKTLGATLPKHDHHKAAAHHEDAAKAHKKAAEAHEEGDHAQATQHSQVANDHSSKAHDASNSAHKKSKGRKTLGV